MLHIKPNNLSLLLTSHDSVTEWWCMTDYWSADRPASKAHHDSVIVYSVIVRALHHGVCDGWVVIVVNTLEETEWPKSVNTYECLNSQNGSLSQLVACFRTKSNLIGQIHCTFSVGRSLTIFNNVIIINKWLTRFSNTYSLSSAINWDTEVLVNL